MIVYHYTSEDAYNEIMRTNEFRPSFFSIALDAAYGEGWYFTDLDPSTTDRELHHYLWRQSVPERVKRYLEFDIEADLLQNARPYVYRLPLDRVRGGVIKLDERYTIGNKEAIKFVRAGSRTDNGMSKPTRPQSSVTSKPVRMNSFNLPRTQSLLEELAEKKVELNDHVSKLGKARNIYQPNRSLKSASTVEKSDVYVKPDHFDRTKAIPFTGG